MRYSIGLPTDRVQKGTEFVSAGAVAEMAAAAEHAGYDAVFVTEHPVPEDRWMATGGHHALDPFVALSFAAAASARLRLHTNLCVVPYRNPFLLAKAAASLDALSGGRLILGAGAGYLEAEFRALGVDYARRNELFDESIRAMKRAWSGESFRFEGGDFAANGHTVLPRPASHPHPPLWIGGNSRRAMRRAAELGQGWSPFPNARAQVGRRHTPPLESVADLRARVRELRTLCDSVGREAPLDLCFMPIHGGQYGTPRFERSALLDHVGELEELGVTWLCVGVAADSRAEWTERARGLASVLGCAAR